MVLTSWGLRGTRRAEVAAENARLAVADVVAEAKGRIGEEVTPPGAAGAGGSNGVGYGRSSDAREQGGRCR